MERVLLHLLVHIITHCLGRVTHSHGCSLSTWQKNQEILEVHVFKSLCYPIMAERLTLEGTSGGYLVLISAIIYINPGLGSASNVVFFYMN